MSVNSDSSVRTGTLLAIAAITMMIAAITSALFVRQGSAGDWHRSAPPGGYTLSIWFILASCVALWRARRAIAAGGRNGATRTPAIFWFGSSLILGVIYLAAQLLVFEQMKRAGLTLTSGPAVSFFYILAGFNALLVLGAWCALLRSFAPFVFGRSRLRTSTFDSAELLWYFAGCTSLYLILLVKVKL